MQPNDSEPHKLTPDEMRALEADVRALADAFGECIDVAANRPEGVRLAVIGAAIATVIGNCPRKDDLWKSVQSALMRGPSLTYDERKALS